MKIQAQHQVRTSGSRKVVDVTSKTGVELEQWKNRLKKSEAAPIGSRLIFVGESEQGWIDIPQEEPVTAVKKKRTKRKPKKVEE